MRWSSWSFSTKCFTSKSKYFSRYSRSTCSSSANATRFGLGRFIRPKQVFVAVLLPLLAPPPQKPSRHPQNLGCLHPANLTTQCPCDDFFPLHCPLQGSAGASARL